MRAWKRAAGRERVVSWSHREYGGAADDASATAVDVHRERDRAGRLGDVVGGADLEVALRRRRLVPDGRRVDGRVESAVVDGPGDRDRRAGRHTAGRRKG